MISNLLINSCIKKNKSIDQSSTRRKLGMLGGVVGITCNIILSISKFIAGVMSSSIAITADAFNNLSDAISSIVTLVCFKTSNSPADKNHPFGYGRIEYISGLIVSILIIFMGIEFTKSSVEKLFSPEEEITNGIIPILILVLSMIIKLWLGSFNKKIDKLISSSAMKATAFDSLSDAIITFTILVAMIINYFTGIYIDAYLGIAVAIFIIFTGIKMLKETLSPLIGQSPDPELIKKIHDISKEFPNILGIHDILVHNYGPGISFVSFHAEVPANKSIVNLHEEINVLEKKLKNKFNCQTIINMDPIITDDEYINAIREKLKALVKLLDKDAKVYDLRIIPGKSPTLIFSISIIYSLSKTDDEIKKSVCESLKKIEPNYKFIVDVNRYYF